jgi:hypothetical protein
LELQDLWNWSVDVACVLIACGVGKGTRVGILMSNRVGQATPDREKIAPFRSFAFPREKSRRKS